MQSTPTAPRFTVVTVCFNAESTIEDTLRSVATQDYPAIEHIVVDGASTDGTLDIVRRYGSRITHLLSEPDKGIYDAMNKGLSLASGDFVGFLNADDCFATPQALGRLAALQANHPGADVLFADLAYVAADDARRVHRDWHAGPFSKAALFRGWMPPHPTFYVRRARLAEVGGFDTSMKIAADYEFMVRCLWQYKLCSAYLSEILVKMRMGGASNQSLRAILRKSAEDLRVIRRYQLGGIGTLAMKNVRKVPQFVMRRSSASE